MTLRIPEKRTRHSHSAATGGTGTARPVKSGTTLRPQRQRTGGGKDLFWLFQEREGLFLYDLAEDRIVAQHSSRRTEYVKIMEKAGGKDGIWVCPEYGREALRFTYRDGGIRLSRRLDFSGAMGDAWVTCLRETEKGTLWIGTDCGLFRHDLEKMPRPA